MRWSLFWIGAVVAVVGYTVFTAKTADDPVVVDGVIHGSHPPPAKIAVLGRHP